MRIFLRLASFWLLLISFLPLSGLRAQFTAGNLVLFRAESASANNTNFSIIELSPSAANQAAPVTTTAINGTTGSSALRTSGSASSTGYLANSNDGSLLCFTGHNTTTTSGNINAITTRGVGTLDASGNFALATTYTGTASNQTRCATSLDNSNWFIGDQGGLYTNGTTTASPTGNFRSVKPFGGTAYIFQASSSFAPVSTLSAPSGGTVTSLPGLANGTSSCQDFYMISSGSNGTTFDVLYVLSASSATAGTIAKYSLVAGSWVANNTYTTTFGGFGLAAAQGGSGAKLYVTTGIGSTAANSVLQLTDAAGYNTDISITNTATLYTTTAGTTLKGVAFAPVTPTVLTGPLMRITEYMYSGANGEFVEFTNVGNTPVDMTGWSYSDNSRHAGDVNLGAFGSVQPGESVILTETAAGDFRTAWHLCNGTKIIGGNSIDNLGRGDEINLYDASGILADRLTYDDQAFPGTIRTQNKSGWVSAAGLGANTIADWSLSSVSDAESSVSSTGGDIGSPGSSTRATIHYSPCAAVIPGAPTIAIDVMNTTNTLDGGISSSPLSPYAVSGVLNDPTDPASTAGIAFTVGDDITPVGNLTVTVSSSNTTVVPTANLVLTGSAASRQLTITPAAVGYSTITVTVNDGTYNTPYILTYAASAAGASGISWPTGISDASAAIALDDDYMVIGNDETNELYVYNRKASGLPVKTFDFNVGNLLALTDGSTNNWKELDIEASAPSIATTGRSYWLGSMSNSSSFNNKPNRDRLIAIDISGTGATTSFSNAGYYAGLRQQLITWGDANGYDFTSSAADGKDPKTIDGFNAEGMVFGPDNTTLYIGLRAPLVPTANRTKAVIAPIQNFETWFNNGASSGAPVIGAPIELDLDHRGIRDLIRLSNGNYIIVAGSYDGTLVPAVYRWTGNASDVPVLLSSFDLTGINAEAAMGVNESGQLSLDKLQIIADDGSTVFYNDGVEAKDLPSANLQKFTSALSVSTTGVVLPITFESFTAERQASAVQLNWKTGTPDNVASFDVLRSENGTDFIPVKTVAAIRDEAAYAYLDANAPTTRLYYRIRTKELTGQSSFSTIRIVTEQGAAASSVKVYPNPVTNGIFSIMADKPGLKIVNVYNNAAALYQQVSFAETSKDISTGNWPKGYYLLRIMMADGSVVTEKIVVQ